MTNPDCNYYLSGTCGCGAVKFDECVGAEACQSYSKERLVPRQPMESRPTNCPECESIGWILNAPIEEVQTTHKGDETYGYQVPQPEAVEIPTPARRLGSSLDEAKRCITGERQDSYGNPEDSFTLIAKYWSAYLRKDLKAGRSKLNALDVAHMMMLFKIARCSGQCPSRDNYIDIQGYAAIAADRLLP